MNYKQPAWYKHDAAEWLSGSIRMFSLEHQALFTNIASIIWRDGGMYREGIEKIAVKAAPIECLRDGQKDRIIQMIRELIDGGLIESDTTGAITIKFLTKQIREIDTFRSRQARNIAQRYSGVTTAAACKASTAAQNADDPASRAFNESKQRTIGELNKQRKMLSAEDMRTLVVMLRQTFGRVRLRGQTRDAINMGIEAGITEWRSRDAQ